VIANRLAVVVFDPNRLSVVVISRLPLQICVLAGFDLRVIVLNSGNLGFDFPQELFFCQTWTWFAVHRRNP
jgi:hypothetical protein